MTQSLMLHLLMLLLATGLAVASPAAGLRSRGSEARFSTALRRHERSDPGVAGLRARAARLPSLHRRPGTQVAFAESLNCRLLGRLEYPEIEVYPLSSVYSNGYWYVTNEADDFFLEVLQIVDSTRLRIAGRVALDQDYVPGLAKDGHYVFAAGNDYLQVIDVQDPVHPAIVGAADLVDAYDLAVHGEHAYVAGSAGLTIFDVSNRQSPTEVGFLALDDCNAVTVSGSLAACIDQWRRLRLIDVSNPESPLLRGTLTLGEAYDVALSQGYAFVADVEEFRVVALGDTTHPFEVATIPDLFGTSIELSGPRAYLAGEGLYAVEIIDPEQPRLIANGADVWISEEGDGLSVAGDTVLCAAEGEYWVIDMSDLGPPVVGQCGNWYAERIDVVRGLACVVGAGTGLITIDVANPTMPEVIGTAATAGAPHDVRLSGTLAYVAADSGLSVFNLLDPSQPFEMGRLPVAGQAWSVRVRDTIACLGLRSGGMDMVSIANPAGPRRIGRYPLPGSSNDLEMRDTLVFLAATGGLDIIRISDPSNPEMVGHYEMASAASVSVAGGRAYVLGMGVSGRCSLYVLDVTDPAQPTLLGCYRIAGSRVVTIDSLTYVASGGGFTILNTARPEEIRLVGRALVDGHDASIQGNFAYVSAWDLKVVDVSDPSGGPVVRYYEFDVQEGVDIAELALLGDYVLAASDSGCQTVDVSDPTRPRPVATCLFRPVQHLALADTLVLLGSYDSLYVVSVGDPERPQRLAARPGHVTDIATVGRIAFVAEDIIPAESAGLRVLDISNPHLPLQVGFCALPGGASSRTVRDLAVFGNYVYASADSNQRAGLHLIDVGNPHAPQLAGFFPYDTGEALRLTIDGTFAYAATGQGGVLVLSLEGGARPFKVARYRDSTGWPSAQDIAVSGTRACVANGTEGVLVLDIPDPANPTYYGHYGDGRYLHRVLLQGDRAYLTGDFSLSLFQIAPTSAVKDADRRRGQFRLSVGPNPARGTARIAYGLGVSGSARLCVFDINGALVRVVRQGYSPAGQFTTTLDTRGLARGVYLVRLETEDRHLTRKLVLE